MMEFQKVNFLATLTLLVGFGLSLPAQAQETTVNSVPPAAVINNGVVVQGGSAYLGNTEVKPTVNPVPQAPQQQLDAVKLQPEEPEQGVFERMVSGIKLNGGSNSQVPTAQFPENRPTGVGFMNLEL